MNENVTSTSSGWRISKDGLIHRQKRKEYPNGDIYEGEFVDRKWHGAGKLKTTLARALSDDETNGDTITGREKINVIIHGNFLNNKIDGFAVILPLSISSSTSASLPTSLKNPSQVSSLPSQPIFKGTFKEGKRNGQGEYRDEEGNLWNGSWIDDHFTGKGVIKYKNGERREGCFVRGKLHCEKGIIHHVDGESYEGSFHYNQLHGMGIHTYSRGLGCYIGPYRYGLEHGLGTRRYLDNSVYRGIFLYGKKSGQGTHCYSNYSSIEKYIGSFLDGVYNGDGELIYKPCCDIKSFQGTFRNGFPYGSGRITYKDDGYYEGEFNATTDRKQFSHGMVFPLPNGLRHGQGVRVWSNGNTFRGKYNMGIMVEGIYYDKVKCSKYTGTFHNDKKSGYGRETWRSPDGRDFRDPCLKWLHRSDSVCKYEGEYQLGMFHGNGKFSASDGRYYDGSWHHNKQHGDGTGVYLANNGVGDTSTRNIAQKPSLYRCSRFVGKWEHGRRCSGTEYFPDGSIVTK